MKEDKVKIKLKKAPCINGNVACNYMTKEVNETKGKIATREPEKC